MMTDQVVTKRYFSITAATACALLILALTACGGSGGDALRDTAWTLVSLSGGDLIPGTTITIEFADDTFSGSGGCNHCGGSYQTSGESLSVSDVFSTEMACMDPAGVMDQESAYLATLRTVDSYQIAHDRLEMFDEAGTQILAFVASTSESLAQQPIAMGATPDLSLDCTLDMGEAYPVDEPVTLGFELHNPTDRPLYVLNWYTPLEGIAGDILEITRDGARLPYQGLLAKRADPTRDEYVAIEPGGTKAAGVDLTTGYDLSTPGTYQVRFTAGLQDVTADETLVARKRNDHQPRPLTCNTTSFRILPPPEPPTAEPTPVQSGAGEPGEGTPLPEPPAGFKAYQDSVAGVSVYIPESWVTTQVFPGESAIFQSYPEDKYVGGEAREPGDTKCDLTIRPADVTLAAHMSDLRSNPGLTVVSEQELILHSGEPGIRVEVESLGTSVSLITEVEARVVVLTCFGEFAPFDEIAPTVGAIQ
jgi:heat shock protein HslJ